MKYDNLAPIKNKDDALSEAVRQNLSSVLWPHPDGSKALC